MQLVATFRTAMATIASGVAMTAAVASVDTSPKPGGVYRLKPGIFVAKGAPCGAPSNAAVRKYDGKGISTAYTLSCTAHILSRRGDIFDVNQSCVGTGVGHERRSVERQTVTVQDALTFSMGAARSAKTYRYCPADQLPDHLLARSR
jgi:hypothetical protein